MAAIRMAKAGVRSRNRKAQIADTPRMAIDNCCISQGTWRLKAQAKSQSAWKAADRIGGVAATSRPKTKMMISDLSTGVRFIGRARATSTRTSGYSHTVSNITGASSAVKAPPTTPPNDSNR